MTTTPTMSLPEIEKEFLEFLKETYSYETIKDDVITIEAYWDYNDQISSTSMNKILEYAADLRKSEPDTPIQQLLEMAICDYGFDEYWFIHLDEQLMENYLSDFNSFSSKIFQEKSIDIDSYQEEFQEFYMEHVELDYNIEKLLSQSYPDDLTIYFGGNWDDDYGSLSVWEDTDYDPTLKDYYESTALGWLLKTQGYTVEDVFDKDKETPFLKQFREEIWNYTADLDRYQLIAIPDSTNWAAIAQLAVDKCGVIKKGTTVGLFDGTFGSGSGLNIELEKDITITPEDKDAKIYLVDPRYHHSSYNYSPRAVYGFSRSHCIENLDIYEKD